LLGILELNGVNSGLARPLHVLGDVVGEEDLVRLALSVSNRFGVDAGFGFHGANLITQDFVIEMTKDRVVRFDHLKVDGIGVGEEQEPVPGSEGLDHVFRDEGLREKDGAPDVAKVRVLEVYAEDSGELLDKGFRLDLAGFEALHESCGPKSFGDLLEGKAAKRGEPLVGALKVEGNQDAPEVEDDGSYHGTEVPGYRGLGAGMDGQMDSQKPGVGILPSWPLQLSLGAGSGEGNPMLR
jgi:hypothetical protein